jgi:hypothetical protein
MDTAQQVTNQSGAGTQDATPTILVEMAMPANGAGFLQIRVCARNPVTKDTRAWWAVYWVKSNDAGVIDVTNPNIVLAEKNDDPGASTWSYSVVAASGLVQIVVTGEAGAFIEWFGMFDGWILIPE